MQRFKMTDEKMIEYLRRHAHWTDLLQWEDIANRLEELVKIEKEKENG